MTTLRRTPFALLVALVSASCGTSSHGTDAGRDVPTPTDADAARDAAVDALPDIAFDSTPDAVSDVDVVDAGDTDAGPDDVRVPDDTADAGNDDGSVVDAGDFDGGTDAGADADLGPIFTEAGCGATYAAYDATPGSHWDAGDMLVWDTNPPSSGAHYPIWAHWGVHSEILPRGYYVHNEEHGGVVVVYRCDGDCSALRAQLINFVNTIDPEPACVGMPYPRRIVLTEDPLIDTPVAAAAWGYTYHADCFDDASLRAFVLRRTGHGPEDWCGDGSYP